MGATVRGTTPVGTEVLTGIRHTGFEVGIATNGANPMWHKNNRGSNAHRSTSS